MLFVIRSISVKKYYTKNSVNRVQMGFFHFLYFYIMRVAKLPPVPLVWLAALAVKCGRMPVLRQLMSGVNLGFLHELKEEIFLL